MDLLVTGGAVWTGATATRSGGASPAADAPAVSDAMLVRGGRVVALGDAARAGAGADAEVLDLAGSAVAPAFRDGHVHPLWGGVELADAPVRDCGSVDEVVAAVRAHAAAHPEREWVLGGSFDPALRPDGRYDARWLDAAVADRPVVLTTADHHAVWCNTAALRRAGIDATTPDPPTGRIERRDDGEPLGTLVEWAAMHLVERCIPARSARERADGLAAAARMLATAGLVWVQEAALAPEDVATYLAVADAGALALRANVALRAEPGQWRDQLPAFRDARALAGGRDDVTVRTVKFFADGVVEHGTAAMLAPYCPGDLEGAGTHGHPVWEAAELAAAVTAMDAAGFQPHIHAIGDAGVRTALDAIEAAAQANGPRDRRPVLAHVQVVHPDDLPRFAALGVVANLEPLWAQLDDVMRDLTLPRLGPERSRWQYPLGALAATGAVLSFGSDWPVSSYRPLEYLPVAVLRQTEDGEPDGGWLPEQRISAAAAWAAATGGTAYQAFDDDAGTLLPGQRADFVQLAEDPFGMDPAGWSALPLLGTWLGGRRTAAGGAAAS